MKYKIKLTDVEFKAVATEIRRASWGVAIFSGVIANANPEISKYIYLLGGLGWLILQVVSMLVDAIKVD